MRVSGAASIMAGPSFAVSLQGCTNGSSHDKVAEAWFPDGQVVATLYEDNGGATTSFGYEVTLREKSSPEQKSAARTDAKRMSNFGLVLKT